MSDKLTLGEVERRIRKYAGPALCTAYEAAKARREKVESQVAEAETKIGHVEAQLSAKKTELEEKGVEDFSSHPEYQELLFQLEEAQETFDCLQIATSTATSAVERTRSAAYASAVEAKKAAMAKGGGGGGSDKE
jgi:chromosome segregation ATPase